MAETDDLEEGTVPGQAEPVRRRRGLRRQEAEPVAPRPARPVEERTVDPVDRIGNRVVATGLLLTFLAWTLGVFGVPFLLEAATVASVILGIRMMRGTFGASGGYGSVMVFGSLAAAILFLFMPALAFLLRLAYAAWLLGGGVGKLMDLW